MNYTYELYSLEESQLLDYQLASGLPLDTIMIPAQIIFSIITAYFFILGIFGLFQLRKGSEHPPAKRFALVVPAHNEGMVIGHLVDNLISLDYPSELYNVFVIADNCTDDTADIARSHGATVMERTSYENRGKGYALEWFFEQLYDESSPYDAVVVFDADNLVDVKFLRHINNRMCDGSQIVQGYIDAKNPTDTWVTAAFAMSFWVSNRMVQLARHNLGLCNYLGGTGMAISLDLLKRIGWGATSLTEDLEFSLKALLLGYRTTFAFEAIVYDEKPLTFSQAWRQRTRWARGHVELFRVYSLQFLREAFKRQSIVLFDAAMMTLKPLLVLMMGIGTFFGVVDALLINIYTPIFALIWDPVIWRIVSSFHILYPFIVFWMDKEPRGVLRWIPFHYPLFVYSWIPIIFICFFGKTRVEWAHTLHTRGIRYGEIIKNQQPL